MALWLSPPPAISESVPEVQSQGPLPQCVALLARQAFALVKCNSEILHDAQLHHGIERVSESVTEGNVRIDVSVGWSEVTTCVTPQVAILQHACGRFDDLVKSCTAAVMKRAAKTDDIHVRVTAGTAFWTIGTDVCKWNAREGRDSSDGHRCVDRFLQCRAVLRSRGFTERPAASGSAIADAVCVE